jgi:hypothetical protein
MKFNNSKDGKLRATVKVAWRIGRWELACAIIREDEYNTFDTTGQFDAWLAGLGRRQVEELLRRFLEERGYLMFEAADRHSDEQIIAIMARVDALFPEVAP